MKLYVPEIGDQIVLTKDWSFTLHAERRNVELAKFFGYYELYSSRLGGTLFINEIEHPPMREADYKVNYPDKEKYYRHGVANRLFSIPQCDYDQLNKDRAQAEQDCPEFVKYWADYAEWTTKAQQCGKNSIPVTLPVGTILGIDRIYIRKGSKDYSSITFFAKNLGSISVTVSRWSPTQRRTVTKKAMRFWTKLEDANNIEFDFIK